MKKALWGKIKLEFVDDTITPITYTFDPLYRTWNRSNMLLHSLIIFVSESIAQSIVLMESAIDVWIDLKEWLYQWDLVHISKLMQEIYGLQQDSKFVYDFYSK